MERGPTANQDQTKTPAQRIYHVHVELFLSSRSTAGASGGPRLREGPGLGPKVVGDLLRGYPVASAAEL
jgi:hypothetical protein